MSIRMRFSSESNISRASIFANWVFPTPVCPKKIKEPMGLSGAFNPARLRWMDFTTFSTASCWPMMLFPIMALRLASLSFSVLTIFCTGTPVIMETTSAIWVSFTSTRLSFDSSSHFSCAAMRLRSTRFSSSRKRAASSYFCFLTTVFLLSRTRSNSSSRSMTSWGTSMFLMWTREPASSSASMALSGKKRSLM